jgi:hypothetical protein
MARDDNIVPGFGRVPGYDPTRSGTAGQLFDLRGNRADKLPAAVRGLHTRQFGALVGNIGHVLNSATDAEIEAGRQWYPQAQDHARRIGHLNAMRHGTRISDDEAINMGAAMLAIHSPQNEWGRNLMAAHSVAARGDLLKEHGLQYTGSQAQLNKSLPVSRGEVDPSEGIVVPGRPRLKTYHFYENIRNPRGGNDFVTIDRHAHDAPTGMVISGDNRGLGDERRYNAMADVYRTAHGMLGQQFDLNQGSDLQAAVWVPWKRLKGDRRPGADFDQYLRDTGEYDRYYSL